MQEKKPDLKQLSDKELIQLILDIDDEIDMRRGRPGESAKGIHSSKFAGESGKTLSEQRIAVVEENKGFCTTIEKFKQDLKAFYQDGSALRAFEQLVSDQCDEVFLVCTVGAIRLAHQIYKKQPAGDSWFIVLGNGFESLAGFNRKKLKTVVGRMRDCAADIKRLRVSSLASLVPSGYQDVAHYIDLQSRVPSDLCELAGVVERAEKRLRLRGRPEYNEDIAGLVRHVEDRTERPHDPEVATMIAFATSNPAFTAEDLRTWRMEHRNLLATTR